MGDIPAAEVARERADQVRTLSTGYRAIVRPVSASLIDDVTSRVEYPSVPEFFNEEKGRPEPNPMDPEYVRQVAAANRQRGVAAVDAIIMFGVELIDPIPVIAPDTPPSKNWVKKLR